MNTKNPSNRCNTTCSPVDILPNKRTNDSESNPRLFLGIFIIGIIQASSIVVAWADMEVE